MPNPLSPILNLKEYLPLFDAPLPVSETSRLPISDDFTLFVKAEEINDQRAPRSNPISNENTEGFVPNTIDLQGQVSFGEGELASRPFTGRIHAAPCFGGKFYSVTLRSLKLRAFDLKWLGTLRAQHEEAARKEQAAASTKTWAGDGALPSDPADWKPEKSLEPAHVLSQLLFDACFPQSLSSPASGLVLFSGATGTGKTTYANGVLHRYLRQYRSARKRAHVIAIGDPVETLLYADTGMTIQEIVEAQRALPTNRPYDFTLRVLGDDVSSVEKALDDALRETPALVVVSELRKDEDFAAALNFAATGHLIFATSHSTTLADALGRLLSVSKADTGAGRATVAQRVRAVIHHQVLDGPSRELWDKQGFAGNPDARYYVTKMNVPSIWRGNSEGRRNLIAEGLSSLVARAPGKGEAETAGVLGRYWISRKLADVSDGSNNLRLRGWDERACIWLHQYFQQRALSLDLQNR